tara:strand:- start:436 stop:792 length:357 start_codon:yes stop_codon:yes gene_type:complete
MNIGVCEGRHVVQTNDGEGMHYYLFENPVESPCDLDGHEKRCREFIRDKIIPAGIFAQYLEYRDINLYITGLTPLVTSFLKCWTERQERLEMTCGDLVLWHWNKETEQYKPQNWAVIT